MSDEGETEFSQMRWSFKLPDRFPFNARSEGIDSSKFWKKMLTEHRCIVPASSFFEWKEVAKGKKDKYEITVPGRDLFRMASLWSPWKNPGTGEWENTFTVITSDPTPKMQPFHDRQPVILNRSKFEEWLAPSGRVPIHLMRILDDDHMDIRPTNPPVAKPEPPMRGLFD